MSSEREPITKKEVSDAKRMQFLPHHFGRYFMNAETYLYNWMDKYATDYNGDYYSYYELSNGGILICPAKRYSLWSPNGESFDDLSSEQVGITVTLFLLNHFMFKTYEQEQRMAEDFSRKYEGLLDYGAGLGQEIWTPIRALID
ncbi:antirestriction protein [Xenorhabdus innexi]|uniref:Antirestriction protein KlcA n=1 Tax=Xenorhabdus innexi TaxID=290109 RepID=A0A1N6MWQ5_9GAMM|nr:antirestriction protein [Xenorhabdus innexi]PHM35960.1 Antirestriction protein KlcA [Xenorhabdus innexi]SIP73260.1 putative KlcA' protein [Xenorhabdus innexi]